MRLLSKYNRINMGVTALIILVTGVVYYYAISHILTGQIDKDLVLEEHEVFAYVKLNNKLPEVYESNHQQIYFDEIDKARAGRRFLDTTYRDSKDKEQEAGRALISSVQVNNKTYRILVIQSKVETEDLIQIIFLITTGVLAVLLVLLLLLNRFILKSIWQPFYRILTQLKQFNLSDRKSIISIPSNIDEFNEMDSEVTAMAERVTHDYQELKAFTENASHELMTPISVINSKLDTLMQTGEFDSRQSKLMEDLYGTVNRLTRLNRSMLLLAKIENGLIKDEQPIQLRELIENALDLQEEAIEKKNIDLKLHVSDKPVTANLSLIEVLVNNLISNAVRHNTQNGELQIVLNASQLVVRNSGTAPVDLNRAVKRFNKSDTSEGAGLGLTLCYQVCSNYGYHLNYSFDGGLHEFSVSF